LQQHTFLYRSSTRRHKKQSEADVEIKFAKDNTNNSSVSIARKLDIAIVCAGNHPIDDTDWAICPYPGEGKEALLFCCRKR